MLQAMDTAGDVDDGGNAPAAVPLPQLPSQASPSPPPVLPPCPEGTYTNREVSKRGYMVPGGFPAQSQRKGDLTGIMSSTDRKKEKGRIAVSPYSLSWCPLPRLEVSIQRKRARATDRWTTRKDNHSCSENTQAQRY